MEIIQEESTFSTKNPKRRVDRALRRALPLTDPYVPH